MYIKITIQENLNRMSFLGICGMDCIKKEVSPMG